MIVRSLILSLVMGATSVGAFAQTTATTLGSEGTTVSQSRKWYEAGKFERQDEAQREKLEQQGFPQYAN